MSSIFIYLWYVLIKIINNYNIIKEGEIVLINYIKIGQRISNARKIAGLTQFEVCEKCNISDKYLSNIERAKSIPSIDTLMRICEVIDTTPDKVLLGTNTDNNTDITQETVSLINLLDKNQLLLLNDFIRLLSEHKI